MDKPENESLSGLRWIDGVLCELVVHKDGRKEYVPIPKEDKEPSFEEFETEVKDPFEGVATRTVPSRWDKDATTNVLEKKSESPREITTTTLNKNGQNGSGRMRTVRKRNDQSCQVEALLIKIFNDNGEGTEPLNVRGNTALKEVIDDLCRIMGEPWCNKRVEL
jgi:hypothetical protein